MPLSRIDMLLGLLMNLSRADVESLPPATRRRLADACHHVAKVAEPKPQPQSGVLADLSNGARAG